MLNRLPERLLGDAARVIGERLGLSFSRERWDDLQRKLGSAATELGHPDAAACARWLGSGSLAQHHIEILASHLTVGETYFYRDKEACDALKHVILPPLLESRLSAGRQLRIWSAGCSSGEEAFTVAIILRQLLPDIGKWSISIVGTDINAKALRKARRGIYSSWSFRGLPAHVKERFFHPHEKGRFSILPDIRSMVSFQYLNLCDPEYPMQLSDGVDIVICRNVFLYFSPEKLNSTLDRLVRSLAPGGWLIVSPVEVPCIKHPRLSAVTMPGVTLFCKADKEHKSVRPALERAMPARARPAAAWEMASESETRRHRPHSHSVPARTAGAVAEDGKCQLEEAQALFIRGLYEEAISALLALDGHKTDAQAGRAAGTNATRTRAIWSRQCNGPHSLLEPTSPTRLYSIWPV